MSDPMPDPSPKTTKPKVALLTNFVPPYRVKFLEQISEVFDFVVLTSTDMETDRDWALVTPQCDVRQQRTLTIRRRSKSSIEAEKRELHLPVSTMTDLWKIRPRAVVSSEMGPRSILAALYCVATRTPLIVWATLSETTEGNVSALRRLVRRVLRQAVQGYITNGQSGQSYIQTQIGIRSLPIVIVPQGSEGPRPGARPPDQLLAPHPAIRLLAVGGLTARKNIGPSLDEMMQSRFPWELDLYGDGPELANLAEHPATRSGRIHFKGFLQWSQILEKYSEYDALFFPSLQDEWGLVVNESLLAGTPVLGSLGSQAVQELVVDGVNGWTFDPTIPGDISRAFLRCASERRTVSREQIKNSAESEASVETFAARWVAAVRNLAGL